MFEKICVALKPRNSEESLYSRVKYLYWHRFEKDSDIRYFEIQRCEVIFEMLSLQDCQNASTSSNQVEAEVIVHLELSEMITGKAKFDCGRAKDSKATRGLSLGPTKENPPSEQSLNLTQQNIPSTGPAANHNGEPEDGAAEADCADPRKDSGLTNGFHSPKTPRPAAKSGEKGDVGRRPSAQSKTKSAGLTPVPFVTSGLVHPTSVAHSYLCP